MRNRLSVRGVVFLLSIGLVACSQAEDPGKLREKRAESPYFDMLGLLDKLETTSRGRRLKKFAIMDQKVEDGVIDSPDFRKEMAVFYGADLTKPAWQSLFKVEEAGRVTSYIPTTDTPELRLLVVHKDSSGKPVRVDISINEDNYLYHNEAAGSLFLIYRDTVPVLDSLSLTGEQKIVFGSPFNYALTGKML